MSKKSSGQGLGKIGIIIFWVIFSIVVLFAMAFIPTAVRYVPNRFLRWLSAVLVLIGNSLVFLLLELIVAAFFVYGRKAWRKRIRLKEKSNP